MELAEPKNKRTRLNPQKRHAQLLHCAVVAFANKGIGRAVHADVAELAGVSVPTVFNYFRTREDLVDAVLTEVERFYLEVANAAHGNDLSAIDALYEHGNQFVNAAVEHQEYVKVWLEWTSSLRDDVWPRYLLLHNRVISQIARTIQRGIDSQEVNVNLTARELAMIFMGSAHSVAMMVYAPENTPDGIRAFMHRAVKVLLGQQP
ncbi:TetR/AcrR family transcriptional regulator [Litoribacillus peritrichatus]|uniref:TetR/AcrR family transcriptional regulator n=1 Tax=Litoribacillus peritrichatus TaxID=718191 RepID=A0ABP7M5U2_9GAMM